MGIWIRTLFGNSTGILAHGGNNPGYRKIGICLSLPPFSAGFFLSLFFYPEDGDAMFLRNLFFDLQRITLRYTTEPLLISAARNSKSYISFLDCKESSNIFLMG
jgi:hypothetical protein